MPNTTRHPSTYSTDELLTMLARERLALTRRLVVVKREVRDRVAELDALESRLAAITDSEENLNMENRP